MARSNAIETAIRHTAAHKLSGKYNLVQYKKEGTEKYEERQKALLHKKVCEEIVAFADANKNIPFYFILSVGVSKGGYKMSEFNKGYKSFDADKVLAVAAMGEMYNEHNKNGRKHLSDVVIRLMMRYYEKKGFMSFREDLDNSEVLGKESATRGHYDKLCENLGIPLERKTAKDEPTDTEPNEPLAA